MEITFHVIAMDAGLCKSHSTAEGGEKKLADLSSCSLCMCWLLIFHRLPTGKYLELVSDLIRI